MATRTKTRWGTDSRGRYTRRVGWELNKDNKTVQHLFYLGTDLAQAKRREDRLVELWQLIEKQWPNRLGRPLWNSTSLWVAKEIAKGNYRLVVERKNHPPEVYARYLHRLQAAYPMVQFVPDAPEVYEAGAETARAIAKSKLDPLERQFAEMQHKQALAGNLGPTEIGICKSRLHEALDAYIEHIKRTAVEPGTENLSDYGTTRVANARRLKERHLDLPLSSIATYGDIQGMIDMWRNRPMVKNSDPPKPISKKTAEHHIGELIRFFRWLSRSDHFDWKKPADFDELETHVRQTAQERQARFTPTQVKRYTLDELKLLNAYATPLERLLLLLGLNCGFGAAEQGRLTIGQLYLHQEHPHADLIRRVSGFESNPHDNFLLAARPKSGVYGEWYLWPQTVKVLKWARQRRERIGNATRDSLLIVSERSKPFFHQTTGGNRGQAFSRRWSDLTRRVQADHSDFPSLSFGKLRKTAGDLVRDVASGEIASVFLCHGHPVKTDDLLDLYTNRPFGKVFAALRELEKKLKSVFDAAPEDLFAQPDRQHESRAKIDKILKLHAEGKSIRDIAMRVGLSKTVVGRHLQNQRVE
jgi:hypothetical protein